MLAFRAFYVLQLAQPHLDTFRGVGGIDRIGGIGPGAARPVDQGHGAGLGFVHGQHGGKFSPEARI
jgi:hypothetical protein